jgi:hypothetical protein
MCTRVAENIPLRNGFFVCVIYESKFTLLDENWIYYVYLYVLKTKIIFCCYI